MSLFKHNQIDAYDKTDVGLSNVDNTSDADKPVSTDTQTALDLKADITGQVFTGAISATNLSGTNTGDQVIPDNTDFVDLTTAQTIAGVKTFSSSPIVPAPTTDLQASTKLYVDDGDTIGSDPAGVTGADQVTNVMSLTTAEYGAITPNASTLYIITDA